MKAYIKLYMDFFGYGEQDFIPCEISGCNNRSGSPHHIDPRGIGGSKHEEDIKNLVGLCLYPHHDEAEKHLLSKGYLKFIHYEFIRGKGLEKKAGYELRKSSR